MARKTKPTGAAIYYHPDGFDASRPKLMGRHVAGESFLAAMARHAATGPLVAFTNGPQHFDDFPPRVTKADPAREPRLIPFAEPERLVEADGHAILRRPADRAHTVLGRGDLS
jgi:hypothetical protein